MSEYVSDPCSIPGGIPASEEVTVPVLALQDDVEREITPEDNLILDEYDEEEAIAELPTKQCTTFLLSEVGKPIFASCGHEEHLCSLFALMQTFVMVVESWNDSLLTIYSNSVYIHFSHRSPLILCIVSRTHFLLDFQIDVIYQQILSTLCRTQLVSVFQKKGPNFDLRTLLKGSERHLNESIRSFRSDPTVFMRCIRIFPMSTTCRDAISTAISTAVSAARVPNVIFGLVIAHRQLVSLVRMKSIILHPSDVQILINLLECNPSFRNADNWIPVCLPHFNDTGFVHVYVSYLWEGSDACLMLISLERGAFEALRAVNEAISVKLLNPKLRESLDDAFSNPPSLYLNTTHFPDVWHFVYKNRYSNQAYIAHYDIPYVSPSERRLLISYYSVTVTFIETCSPVKQIFTTNPDHCIFCWTTPSFELHCVMAPFVSRTGAVSQADRLLKALKKDESRFFVSFSSLF